MMSAARILRLLPPLVALALVLLAILSGCTSKPDEPAFDNPFDPDSPTGDNPFALTAVYDGEGTVFLEWNQLSGFALSAYEIHRVYRSANDTILATMAPGEDPIMNFTDTSPVPNATNSYYIRAMIDEEQGAQTSSLVPATVAVPPVVALVSGATTVISRYQDVTISSSTGDIVELALDDAFLRNFETMDRPAEGPALFENYDLDMRESDEDIVVLYARAVWIIDETTVIYSGIDSLPLPPGFNPTISLIDGGNTVASPINDLYIGDEGEGVDQMRFASDKEGLGDATWMPGAAMVEGFIGEDTIEQQFIYGEFVSEFGFIDTTSLYMQADPLTDLTFQNTLPGGNITSDGVVPVEFLAVASEMRISQYADFHDVAWVPYDTASVITLEGDQGARILHAQARNHWFRSGIETDLVYLSGADVSVQILYPLNNTVVEGDYPIEMFGTANSFNDDYVLTAVQVWLLDDNGDGNWVDAEGTDEWQASWTVPRFTQDTETVVGARAQAEDGDGSVEVGTQWITVTVSQLSADITYPTSNEQLPVGELVVITGTATPYINGAPLDSVVVTFAGNHVALTDNMTSWQTYWDNPEAPGTSPEPYNIIARAWAGGESHRDSVYVTVIPIPPVEITSPEHGDRLPEGVDVTITGTTGPDLAGAPLDSLVVDFAGEHVVFTEVLPNWEVIWEDPVASPVDIVASVWADGTSFADTVSVKVVAETRRARR